MPDASDFEWEWDEEKAEELFDAYARFGNHTSNFKQSVTLTGKNMDKWMKEAGVIDGTVVTTILTGIAFSKETGRTKKSVDFEGMKNVLVNVAVAKYKKDNVEAQDHLNEMTKLMTSVRGPSTEGTTKTSTSKGVYDRLTNPERENKKRRKSIEKRRKDGRY